MFFQNREQAGNILAESLSYLKNTSNLIVLGLPRGGVVAADKVARYLNAPLDVIICRKIGAPGDEEFAIGAISEAGGLFLNKEIIKDVGISQKYIDEIIAREKKKIELYQEEFRSSGKKGLDLKNKTVIIVDDGAATGMTIKAAVSAIRAQKPAKIIITLPVAPFDTAEELASIADEVVILYKPSPFWAVGNFYIDFRQVETEEVKEILTAER